MAGAEVGTVKKVERTDDLAGGATVTMQLTEESVIPPPRDSRVQIRTRSQVGETYLAIVVGTDKQTVPENGTLGIDRADELVSVDQILSVLQGKTRERRAR